MQTNRCSAYQFVILRCAGSWNTLIFTVRDCAHRTVLEALIHLLAVHFLEHISIRERRAFVTPFGAHHQIPPLMIVSCMALLSTVVALDERSSATVHATTSITVYIFLAVNIITFAGILMPISIPNDIIVPTRGAMVYALFAGSVPLPNRAACTLTFVQIQFLVIIKGSTITSILADAVLDKT